MKHVRRHIADKQGELLLHGFFTRLERNEAFEKAMEFAPGLTFWVFAFQDILRLNELRVQDPGLRRIARHHKAEDRGHDAWFLQDVAALDPTPRDFRWLFGPHHAQTRDAAYALVSEVFRTDNDYVRIALLLTLESAGHVFFERMAAYVERNNPDGALQYFSKKHLDVERDHQLFEAEMLKQIEVELPTSVRNEAISMIDRCYEAFGLIFSGLEGRIVRRASGTYSIMPGPASRQLADRRK
ncbi:MAG TPA: hypothetical protein VHB21_01830 [Minicystis sp.]|nr:hypothetical protein [Minicystis sp.]